MGEKEFNLLKEPWLRVLTSDLEVMEVSLAEILIHADKYKSLAGEMPTQDVAVLRLLLACMQTIFYRYDADGEEADICEGSYEDVLERWENYWIKGKFSEECILEYFKKYEERFWLFHPETPFYQVAGLAYGTDYQAQSLFGNLKSSNNRETKYHFSQCEGENVKKISYSEAARWLLNLNGFGVNVKADKKAPGTTEAAGTGRLGSLGLIYVEGENLFELIMLNLTPLTEGNEPWGEPYPIWEQPIRSKQSIEIAPPDNLPELYTIQSRRILLKRTDGYVTGFRAMNGDHYPVEDDFTEQMTVWKKHEKKKKIYYTPRKHSPEIQAWREFPSIFNTNEDSHTPGVVKWINTVYSSSLDIGKDLITFKTAGLQYGERMSYTYGECLSDGITLSSELLRNFSREWMTLITDEIEKCRQVSKEAIKAFSEKIEEVLNQDKLSAKLSTRLSGEYYSLIDYPFRDWLAGIKPDKGQKEAQISKWEKISYRMAVQVAENYIDTLKNDIYKFHDNGKRITSIPEAYNEYLWKIGTIYK